MFVYCPGTEQKALVLVSGGIDSYVALKLAKAEGYHCEAVYFSYGHKAQAKEVRLVREICGNEHVPLQVYTLPPIQGGFLTDKENTDSAGMSCFLPGRNTVFLVHAAQLAYTKGFNHLFLAVNKVPYEAVQYPDSTEPYVRTVQALLDGGMFDLGRSVTIHAPFAALYKSQVIGLGQRFGVPFENTSSCYNPTVFGLDCGICGGCQSRKAGFSALGLADPTIYAPKPLFGPK